MKINFRNISLLGVLLLVGCANPTDKTDSQVHHYGALKDIMSGNISATFDLDGLADKEHIYALGAVSGLKGEIQIFDGSPIISSVKNMEIEISETFDDKASLLVYSQVESWQGFDVSKRIEMNDLEKVIYKMADSAGINTRAPFPFLIEGTIEKLDWHIIDWKEGDSIHTHKKHKESGKNGILSSSEVVILGFYSKKHKAIFTHHSTDMHLHFKTKDDSLAGHVDDVILKTARIKLPKTKIN